MTQNPLQTAAFTLAYRLSSLMWLAYALALALTARGSALLSWAEPFRLTVLTLALLCVLAMLVRLVVPRRPEWTRWTLPLIGTLSTATCTLTVFASEMAGGLTTSRLGYALLLLTPAFAAYVHWVGERVVSQR